MMVPGDGPHDAKGMVIGEAPGHKEVAEGRPFVGASGTLLETALRSLGLLREELYVTNVVKEIPLTSDGKTRRPFPEEIKAWASYLNTEIVTVAPVAILCLGRTAVDAVMEPDTPFGEMIGHTFAAWHPAYLLRGGGDREEWLEQLRGFAEALGRYEYPS